MLVYAKSTVTGKTNVMDLPITQRELDVWKDSNMLVQDFFPNLTPEQREFILTGVTPEKWDAVFGDEE